jgi:hypothetical protein
VFARTIPARAGFDAEMIEILMIFSGLGLLLSLLATLGGVDPALFF